jgi:hypothetical protein
MCNFDVYLVRSFDTQMAISLLFRLDNFDSILSPCQYTIMNTRVLF